MKSLRSVVVIGLAIIAGCEARNPSPALTAPPEAEAPLVVAVEPELAPAVDGLELRDSATGISLLDAGPQDDVSGLSPPKFALHCHSAAKTLEAVAPARQLGDYALAGPAQFLASGQAFAGEAVVTEENGAALSLTLPLTPELLAAVATATTVRVAIGDGFAESNIDLNGAFPGFAGQCSLKSGVALPPP